MRRDCVLISALEILLLTYLLITELLESVGNCNVAAIAHPARASRLHSAAAVVNVTAVIECHCLLPYHYSSRSVSLVSF